MIAAWVIAAALALEPGSSSASIETDRVAITLDVDELADRIDTSHLEAATPLLSALTLDVTWVSVDGERCQLGRSTVEPLPPDGVVISAPMYCPDGETWRYFPTWIRGRDPGHRHEVFAFGQRVGTFGRDDRAILLEGAPPPQARSPVLVAAGVGFAGLLGAFLTVLWWLRSAAQRPVA